MTNPAYRLFTRHGVDLAIGYPFYLALQLADPGGSPYSKGTDQVLCQALFC
jgi:hypothetical protein